MSEQISANKSFIRQQVTYSHKANDILSIINILGPREYYTTSAKLTTLVSDDWFITLEYHINHFSVVIYSNSIIIEEKTKLLDGIFSRQNVVAKWVVDQHGSVIDIPIDLVPIHKEAYPYIDDMQKYAENFFNSSANILLMPGEPGTGKTNFIKFLISTQVTNDKSYNVYLTYSDKIIDNEYFFSNFVEDNSANLLLLEDQDSLLTPRSEGNTAMVKLLNAGDGIISIKKKIVITTNISNVAEMDEALTRPGRCYDILKFRELTHDEAVHLSQTIGVAMPSEVKKTYSLSEIYNSKATTKKSTIGF